MLSLIVILFLQLQAMDLFNKFCAGIYCIDEHMDIFLDIQSTKDTAIKGGISIFKYIYNAPVTTLGEI